MLTDDAMEKASAEPTPTRHTTRSEAVGHAVSDTCKELLLQQAHADAERLANDPDDQAEIQAIQRFMGGV